MSFCHTITVSGVWAWLSIIFYWGSKKVVIQLLARLYSHLKTCPGKISLTAALPSYCKLWGGGTEVAVFLLDIGQELLSRSLLPGCIYASVLCFHVYHSWTLLSPAVEALQFLNHWIIREVPNFCILNGFINVPLTYNKLHIFKVYRLMSLDICRQVGWSRGMILALDICPHLCNYHHSQEL